MSHVVVMLMEEEKSEVQIQKIYSMLGVVDLPLGLQLHAPHSARQQTRAVASPRLRR